MFTGIVRGLVEVKSVEQEKEMLHCVIELPDLLRNGLTLGASVAIDGVCLTVVEIAEGQVAFDIIKETLQRTTLADLKPGRRVNVERAAKFGDEMGGHQLSGHVYGTAKIDKLEKNVMTIICPVEWMKYLFEKGFIAIDGVSLTVVDVNSRGFFSVHLIPETLRATTLGFKKPGTLVNIEIDSHTQAIVDTIERMYRDMFYC